MSEEEKTIENLRKNKGVSFAEADIILNLIEKQQKEIDKQNKVIDEMAQELIDMQIRQLTGIDLFRFTNKEDTKQYFIRKVEEDEH